MHGPRSGLTVLYDSSCPLCRREVAFYRRRDRRGRVQWLDLRDRSVGQAPGGIPREQALRRLHAVDAHGRVFTGARAFAAIWQRIPGLRLAGRLLATPPLAWLAEWSYRGFLRVRPRLSRALARFERRGDR